MRNCSFPEYEEVTISYHGDMSTTWTYPRNVSMFLSFLLNRHIRSRRVMGHIWDKWAIKSVRDETQECLSNASNASMDDSLQRGHKGDKRDI